MGIVLVLAKFTVSCIWVIELMMEIFVYFGTNKCCQKKYFRWIFNRSHECVLGWQIFL